LTLPALAEDVKLASTANPQACSSRSVDNTSAEMKAMLAAAKSVRAIGVPAVHMTSASRVATQEFLIEAPGGGSTTVSVSCAASGCIAGCATTGCNPTTINGQPACSSLQCMNSGGLPCSIQGTCSKTVTQTGTSAAPEN
jgi:hypothetical protein